VREAAPFQGTLEQLDALLRAGKVFKGHIWSYGFRRLVERVTIRFTRMSSLLVRSGP
jgi:hypothetical protein